MDLFYVDEVGMRDRDIDIVQPRPSRPSFRDITKNDNDPSDVASVEHCETGSTLPCFRNTEFKPGDLTDDESDFMGNWSDPPSPVFRNTQFQSEDLTDDEYDFEGNWSDPPSPVFRNTEFQSVDLTDDESDFESNWSGSPSPIFRNTEFQPEDLTDDESDFESNWPDTPSPVFRNTEFQSEDLTDDESDFEPNYPPLLTMEQVRNAQYRQPQQHTVHSTQPVVRPLSSLTDADKLHEAYIKSLLNAPKDSPVTKEDLALFAQLISDRNMQAQQVQITQARQIQDLQGHGTQQVGDNHGQETIARRSSRRKPRNLSTKELHKLIRKFAFILMKRVATGNQNPDPITSVTLEEIKSFLKTPTNPTKGPSVDRFILDFNTGSGAASPWNKKATAVFVQEFIQSYEHYTKEAISAAFRTHLFQLKNQFKVYTKYVIDASRMGNQVDILTSRESAILIARIGRRRSILNRRADACLKFLHYPDIKKHQIIWDFMPLEAISGDETDHYDGVVRYIVTTLPWRAVWIHEWMLVFDRLHLASRFRSGRATPGAFPHIRISGDKTRVDRDCTTPPVGLPSNFYCPDWLAKQTPGFIEGLKMLEPIDLEFSRDLIRIAATCRFVTSHRTPPLPLEQHLNSRDSDQSMGISA